MDTHDTPRILTKRETAVRLGLSCRTVERLVAAGVFPKPLQLSPGRVAWLHTDVLTFLDSKLHSRIGRTNT